MKGCQELDCGKKAPYEIDGKRLCEEHYEARINNFEKLYMDLTD